MQHHCETCAHFQQGHRQVLRLLFGQVLPPMAMTFDDVFEAALRPPAQTPLCVSGFPPVKRFPPQEERPEVPLREDDSGRVPGVFEGPPPPAPEAAIQMDPASGLRESGVRQEAPQPELRVRPQLAGARVLVSPEVQLSARAKGEESGVAPLRVVLGEFWAAACRHSATTAKPRNPLWISTTRVSCRTSLGLVAALTSGARTMHKRSRLETQNPSSFLSSIDVGERIFIRRIERHQLATSSRDCCVDHGLE